MAELGYGDGKYLVEPPDDNGLVITDLFRIVEPDDTYPAIKSQIDSQYQNVAIITHDDNNAFGGMWARKPLDLRLPFKTIMYLYLGHKYDSPSAGQPIGDGMTFTMHNDSGKDNAIGGPGEGLGTYRGRMVQGTSTESKTVPFGTYLRNALVLEFDTYYNQTHYVQGTTDIDYKNYPVVDPVTATTGHCALIHPTVDFVTAADHIALRPLIEFEPEQDWMTFVATWTPTYNAGVFEGGSLAYYLGWSNDPDNVAPTETYPITSLDQLRTIFGDDITEASGANYKVYWGFTGATGGLTAVQAAAISRLPDQGLEVEKHVLDSNGNPIDGGFALAGQELTYQITTTAVSVNADVAISNVSVEDFLSTQHTEYVAGSATATVGTSAPVPIADPTPDPITGTYTFPTNATLAAVNDSVIVEFKVKIKPDAPAGGRITNYADVTASGGINETYRTNTTLVNITRQTAPIKAVSTTSNAGRNGAAVKPGDQIIYEITYQNSTGYTANLTIADRMDPQLIFDPNDTMNQGATYNNTTRVATWHLANVPAGGTGVLRFRVTVDPDTANNYLIANHAALSINGSTGVNSNIVENLVEDPIGVKSVISAVGSDGARVKRGDILIYQIEYKNNTAAAATMTIVDRLPIGVDYMWSNNRGQYDESKHVVTWTIPDVPAGDQRTVELTVKVNDLASILIANYAIVTIGTDTPYYTNVVKNPLRGETCLELEYDYPCRTMLKGRVTWADNANAEGVRPPVIDVVLIRDGLQYKSISIVTASGTATYAFLCLPKNKNYQVKYVYHPVQEGLDIIDEYYSETQVKNNFTNTILNRNP